MITDQMESLILPINSISCDIVILPEPVLLGKTVSASQRLEQFDNFYVLEDGKYFPHVSLYMLELKTEDIPRVEECLRDIASVFSPLQLEAYRYDHTMGFIDAEYKIIPELATLQERVVAALNSIRNGMREKDRERMLTAQGIALKNFQDYGYKSIGELFRPHISLTRLKEPNDSAMEVLSDVNDFSGSFLRLGIFEMGDNGTCIREIKTFGFSG
jgi:hypothetical protein